MDQIVALGHLAANKGFKGPALVISGGAVQVASPTAFVKAPAGPQVPLTQAPYASPPAQSSSSAAPSWKPAAASPPPAAAAAPAAGGNKFCGNCGTKRADENAKFCGGCGTKY